MRLPRWVRRWPPLAFPVAVAGVLVVVERPSFQYEHALGTGNVLVGAGYAVMAVILARQPGQRPNATLLTLATILYVIDESHQLPMGQFSRWVTFCGPFVLPLLGALLLRYPGTALDRPGRWFIRANVVMAALNGAAQAVLTPVGFAPGHPETPAFHQLEILRSRWWTAAAAVFLVLLARRWLRLGGLERRILAPILAAATLIAVLLASALLQPWLPKVIQDALAVSRSWAAVGIFISFVISAEVLRWSLTGVARLASTLSGPVTIAAVEAGLRTALADPSLRVYYWLPDQGAYVDSEGTISGEKETPTRFRVPVPSRSGEPLALIDTDPGLRQQDTLLRSAVAVSRLALENARLEAQLRFQLTETEQARTRLLRSGLEQRRQLERDLHDGAQQHLLAVAMRLGAAEALTDDPRTAEAVRMARKELADALAELRDLARGIYPAELSQSGLRAALETVTARLPIVVYTDVPDTRWPPDVESAAYFVACEGLTNAAKHAAPCTAWLTIRHECEDLVVTVRNDGPGAAQLNSPDALPGLRDRLEALGGTLHVRSDDHGTTLTGRIPCPVA